MTTLVLRVALMARRSFGKPDYRQCQQKVVSGSVNISFLRHSQKGICAKSADIAAGGEGHAHN
jgi:hypothetical protein